MPRIADTLAPPRLGPAFRRLLASSWIANLADGIELAAGPLLVASLTGDAFLIALAATFQWLPPLVFALPAGALSDRLDRRRLVIAMDGLRTVLLLGLAVLVVTDVETIALVLAFLFAIATCEVFADNASQTLLPTLVERDDLAVGNARLQVGMVAFDSLIGPPLGAALFAAGHAVPFVAGCVLVTAAALVLARMRPPAWTPDGEPRRLRRDLVAGFAWVRRNAAVRTLVITITIFNLTFGAAFSVLVLYARERLGLGAVGFGLLTTALAVGGLAGTLAYDRIARRVSLADLMRIGLILETFTHLGLALTTTPVIAFAIFVAFGAHAFVWATTSVTVRQRAVPVALQGRVGAVDTVGTFGGLVLGSVVGGALARAFDVTAPFWFAFAGSAIFVVVIWRSLRHIAHAEARQGVSRSRTPQ